MSFVLFCVGLGIKLLLWPAYHSTDFEVHRNWLAITNTLPIYKWYFEDRSEWTLDYPPFFAWFEWVLSQLAHWWDPRIVDLNNPDYSSWSCVAFQRSTVLMSEILLYAALSRFVHINHNSVQSKAIAMLTFLSPGFVFVDHIHFQYNGFLFGVLVYSLVFALEGRHLLSGVTFAILLCFKHIFIYIAPAYFIYLLRSYCMASTFGSFVPRLTKLGALVIAVFALAFGPFIAMGQVDQLVSRLFPFKRGLCHAYWAPNFWAIYSFTDRCLVLAARLRPDLFPVPVTLPEDAGSSTRGLVGNTHFSILPDIAPSHAFIATAVAQLPALVVLFLRSNTNGKVRSRKKTKSNGEAVTGAQRFIQSVVLCAYASFMFGWHVHEKAILLVLTPLSLLMAKPSRLALRMFATASVSGLYGLFPLLFGIQERPIKALVMLSWTICMLNLLRWAGQTAEMPVWRWMSFVERIYILGLVPLFAATEILPPALVFGQMEFLPLALVSVYTAFGVTYSWFGLIIEFLAC